MRNLFFAVIALVAAANAPCASAQTLAITSVNVISTRTGAVAERRTLIIRDGRIARIQSARARIPSDAQRIDAQGAYALPGLTDAHAHSPLTSFNRMLGSDETLTPSAYASALAPYLANGVTQVVLMMGDDTALQARDAQTRGEILAPLMVVASPPVSGAQPILPPPVSRSVANAAEAEALAAEFAAAGYDFIKLREDLTPELHAALARAARRHGLTTIGHMPNNANDLADVFAAPLMGAAHLYDMLYAEPYRSGGPAALAAFLRQRDAFVVTTLSVHANILAKNADYQATVDTECARLVDPRLYALWTGIQFEPSSSSNVIAAEMERHRALLPALASAGVPVIAGTDSGAPTIGPGCSLHDELQLIRAAGLTPLQTLQAATRTPAHLFPRLAHTGEIRRGALANIVLLDANPLDDISNTRRIRAVVAGGRYLDRDALDAMLSAARRP